ncbi:IS110 family transposase [Paenibacillus macerans]|uniref:IS110 family transposase n=1 Tax=Paenibacillus macerans TaxID=44252 RepID=UPI001B22D2DA|nr:IS110 family transposase [Paenibacillus macerans]MDU5948137.1 IS110 family transposase [Paenibacillus macerans]MEC0141328.1 IS110 family transposase [Paenibacillus macerans]GIP14348.1 IS110 family transposase [Paenibacillus macerans]
MKSTRIQTTNQRIERITMQHAIIGIDIAKDVHAAQVTDFRGRVLTPRHLSFANTREGFEKLLRWTCDVQDKHHLSSLIIGMEPTGHYWFNLANWLREQGITVVLVNPVTVHRNKENRDNCPSKNDPKDALNIADVVSRGFYTDYTPEAAVFKRLKAVMSDREFWVKQQVSLGNRIIRWIDLKFPEFRSVFPDWTVLRSLASLRAFPLPSDLQGLRTDDVIEAWRKQGMKRAGGVSGKAKAARLLLVAAHSIGDIQALEEARRDLQRLLDAYEYAVKSLEEIEQEVKKLLGCIPLAGQLRSIKGLGTITIAALLACAGDLRNYAHGRQLLRRAGLNLAERTSGKFKGQIKLSKRGDSMLRKYLYLGVLGLVGQHPDFKRWHEYNLKKGMKKMASITKLIGKLARILIGMVQKGEPYRSEIAVHRVA